MGFSHSLAHGRSRGDTASDGHEQVINVLCTTPLKKKLPTKNQWLWRRRNKRTNLLMCEDIATDITLLALNELYISFHTLFRKVARKEVANVGVRVQATELFPHCK